MRSDRELIASYRAGAEEAFAEFYGRHRRPLFAFLLCRVREREAAEELLQETFFALLRSLDRLDGSPSLRPFLARTARNLAIDFLRRKRSGERALEKRAADPLFRAEAPGGWAESPEDAALRREGAERMSALLHGLPEEQREAVVLRIFLGLTFGEIARLEGCPEATAVSRYRYGIGKLRAALVMGGSHEGDG